MIKDTATVTSKSALDVVARENGYKDWRTMQRAIKRARQAGIKTVITIKI